MAIVTLGELLDRVEEFENRLSHFYADLRDRSKDNGVRLLTYYLARHRRHMRQAFADLETQTLEPIRAIEIREDIPFTPGKEFSLLQTMPGCVKGADLLNAAIAHNEQLMRLYARLLKEPLNMDATSLLQSLSRIEERDIVMLKKMVSMHYF